MRALYLIMQIAAILTTAAYLVGWQFYKTQILRETRVSLDYYMDGTAHRPFAFRILVPGILRSIDATIPSTLSRTIDEWGMRMTTFRPRAEGLRIRSGPDHKYPRTLVWLAVIGFLGLIAFAYASKALYEAMFPGAANSQYVPFAALVAVGAILGGGIAHIYDFPTLGLIACLYWLLATKRHYAYLAVFTLACLNKETTVMVVVSWAAVQFGKMPISRYAAMLLLQAGIFMLIYGLARFHFGDNPGSPMEFYFHDQLSHYRAQPISFFLGAATVIFLVTFQWEEKPEFLRRATIMLVPLLFLVFLAAYPGEFRNLYEALPILLPLIVRNCTIIARQWSTSIAEP